MLNLLFLLVLSPYTAICVGAYAAYKVYRERQEYIYENSRLLNPWNIGLILLAVWCFIVGVVNKSVLSTLASGAFILYLSISILIQSDLNSEELVDNIFKNLLKISVAAGIFGLFEIYGLAHYDMNLWKMYIGVPINGAVDLRMSSTFVNSNVAGDWFAIMVLVAFNYYSRTGNKKDKMKYMAMGALFVVCLILSGSRGAFAGLIVGIIALFVAQGRNRNLISFVSIVAIIGIIGFMPKEVSAISGELVGHDIGRSFYTREDIWRGAVKMFSEKPVTGWGLTGTIEHGKQFFTTDRVVFHAHNIWLSLASSLGIVGLSIYLYMRASVYSSLYVLYKSKSKLLPLIAGIQMLLITHGVIDFTIITPQIGILFMATSSLAVALASKEVPVGVRRAVIQTNYPTL